MEEATTSAASARSSAGAVRKLEAELAAAQAQAEQRAEELTVAAAAEADRAAGAAIVCFIPVSII